MARLILVRHGETGRQSSMRYWGKTDVPLGDLGRSQAEKIAARLASEKIGFIYSSPLVRASETARIIASRHRLEVITCAELREIDFGELEGLEFSEIKSEFPEIGRAWEERSSTLAYPGGESLVQLEERVAGFMKIAGNLPQNGTAVVVAHYGVLRSLICRLLDLEMRHRWNIKIDLASVSIVETYPGINILCLLNDLSHLALAD